MTHSGNIRLIQPCMFELETDSKEEEARMIQGRLQDNVSEHHNAFYISLSTTPDI